MGIDGIDVLKDPEDQPELERKACPNIFSAHKPHQWGEKGRVYWCTGSA